jgi:hypothetical protein
VTTLPSTRIERALQAARAFLAERQSADGAWRSATYGLFKDGTALTPLVVTSLLASEPAQGLPSLRGAGYLASLVRSDGDIDEGPYGLSYPAYTAALAILVLSHPGSPEFRGGRAAWLKYLRERQLTEPLGWQPEDSDYGGWGYAHSLPRKRQFGEAGDLLTESNLSATAYALEALRAAGCPPGDPAFGKALVFVRRCQNFGADPDFDDGGFFFRDQDPVRNKAGCAGTDRLGRPRYASYGSMTADGLRALLTCRVPWDNDRVEAARRWLERHGDVTVQPGHFGPGRAFLRDGFYYYYCRSLARVLTARACEERVAELAGALLQRQRPDGSWSNEAVEGREDDPLVATPLAVLALVDCVGKPPVSPP